MNTITLTVSPALALLLVARLGPLNNETAMEHINKRAMDYPGYVDFELSMSELDDVLGDAYDACNDFLKRTQISYTRKHDTELREFPPREETLLLT